MGGEQTETMFLPEPKLTLSRHFSTWRRASNQAESDTDPLVLLKSILWTPGICLHHQTHSSPENSCGIAHFRDCSMETVSQQLWLSPFQHHSSRSLTCRPCHDAMTISLGSYNTLSTSEVVSSDLFEQCDVTISTHAKIIGLPWFLIMGCGQCSMDVCSPLGEDQFEQHGQSSHCIHQPRTGMGLWSG